LLIARADSDVIHQKFAAQTGEARSLGIFGIPTFVIGKEIFGVMTGLKMLLNGHKKAQSRRRCSTWFVRGVRRRDAWPKTVLPLSDANDRLLTDNRLFYKG
jgi:hypothetical protein